MYIDKGILKHDPFAVLDQNGVGQLVRMAVAKGREVKPLSSVVSAENMVENPHM